MIITNLEGMSFTTAEMYHFLEKHGYTRKSKRVTHIEHERWNQETVTKYTVTGIYKGKKPFPRIYDNSEEWVYEAFIACLKQQILFLL